MTPHAVLTGDVTPDHLAILAVVREVAAGLPDGLTCHQVCRACAERLGGRVAVRRGFFAAPGVDHGWLLVRPAAGATPESAADEVIIDPYPVAGASGPLLVCLGGILNPWRRLYLDRTDTPHDTKAR